MIVRNEFLIEYVSNDIAAQRSIHRYIYNVEDLDTYQPIQRSFEAGNVPNLIREASQILFATETHFTRTYHTVS